MYLLDTGIVLGFQKGGHLEALITAAAVVSIVLVEEVYDELTEPRNGRHEEAAARAKTALDASRITVRSIRTGSDAAATFAALRTGKKSATADLGETGCIALAAHDPSLTFITNDAAASLRSLQELRGRTMSFHPFVAAVVESGALSPAAAASVATAVKG